MAQSYSVRFWLAGLVLAGALIWLLSGMLLPFVAGMAVAYLLDPIVERLVRLSWPRPVAVTAVTLLAGLLALLLLALLVPLLRYEMSALAERLPGFLQQLQGFYATLKSSGLFGASPERFDAAIQEMLKAIGNEAGAIASGVFARGAAVLNTLSLILITPMVAFYLMLDWPKIVAALDDWLPRHHAPTLRRLSGEMDSAMAGFVRGQLLVCAIQAVGYAAALSLAGLEFGVVIGLLTGLLSFIPIAGAVIGLGLSMLVAVSQFWPDWTMVLLIAGIFFAGQLIEGNLLTPYLVGSRVGLHPVWIIFALLAFGSLFGFLGLLLAVPAAAAIGVLTRFGLETYKSSPYYTGPTGPDAA